MAGQLPGALPAQPGARPWGCTPGRAGVPEPPPAVLAWTQRPRSAGPAEPEHQGWVVQSRPQTKGGSLPASNPESKALPSREPQPELGELIPAPGGD